ncbi:MAG: sensor histidine kinase [Chloroflexi bacterium]|nr:MAG: sensor histidine kinase [Chloroflexota bacterium]
MRSLRSRLILSHILPILVIVPLVGIALIYMVETQVLLANLTGDLDRQAALAAQIAAEQPGIWNDTGTARTFVTGISTYQQTNVMLLDPNGKIIVASHSSDSGREGQTVSIPSLTQLQNNNQRVQINYNKTLQVQVAEILVPILDSNQHLVGFVQLTRQLSNVNEQFRQLRLIIVGVLVGELVLGVIVGLVLAFDLERSLRRVTEAIYGVASGRNWATLPERGPQEIRLLLRAFNTLIERLRMMEDARRRLLANMVHEVSRPVGAMQAAIEALLNGADQDEKFRRQLLAGMEEEVDRLQPLLTNLTELHDKVLGTLELNCQTVEPASWLTRTIATWREAALSKGLNWQANIPETLPELEADPDRLAQVVGNLLSNAIKYTPKGGQITVTAGQDNEQVWITVADTGAGISAEEQERIFEPFFRSQPGRRFPQGMGLGLTIARDLTTAHGGRLSLQSQPGQGSQFTVWLPINPQAKLKNEA